VIIKHVFAFIVGIIVAFLYEYLSGFVGKNIFNTDSVIVSGYKLHHSLYGLFFIILGLLRSKNFYVWFGLGIIFQHTLTDGFLFIQKYD
jgi:hypothetical protein